MRSSPRILSLGLVLIGLSGCGSKPTEAECEAFADHFVKLLQESREKPDSRIRKLASDQRETLIGACVSEGTAKEVECVMAQASIGDVEANCK